MGNQFQSDLNRMGSAGDELDYGGFVDKYESLSDLGVKDKCATQP